ncbi:tumor necrosis factor ligand superfamily member 6 isoform X1 [Entelurus aequoreus]|uniref:tumor necrosis factor ligand superfamily member 6 isoform X1 n=1 Tax=Entelurus aequoreus TaxID=161455 RepID=UPI002B1E70F7|nr:tumor necrosis factor ligand superfamily member 6 isoform X1 [Entelurus aequoreus]
MCSQRSLVSFAVVQHGAAPPGRIVESDAVPHKPERRQVWEVKVRHQHRRDNDYSVLCQAKTLQEPSRAEKLIGVGAEGAGKREERKESEEKAAAHMLGRVEKVAFRNTLRWDPRVGHAFTAGGVAYQVEDGALRVNRSGLYHVYSRVELIFRRCSPTSSFVHTVFVMRTGHPLRPLTLMEAHRAGFCSRAAEQAWTADSYLGSAVRLEERDRVLVNVSHPQHLSHSHDGNFFGLYQI